MPPARLAHLVSVTVLLLACGDSGGDSATATTSATGTTGITSVPDTTTAGTTGTDAGATDGDDGSGSDATQPTTTGDATTTTTGTGSATDVDPFDSTTDAGTTWDSFGDSTGGALCKPQIDIVFVMDVSTSMFDILQKLEAEILAVDAKLKTFDVLPDIHYGLVVFVDDTLFINAGAPYLDVQALEQDFEYYWMFTQSNSQVSGEGSNEDFPENTLDALYLAASEFQWRPAADTLRMVIHTTDDTFGEKGAVQSGVTIERTYDETVLALQDQQVRVFTFADDDMTGGPADNQDVSMGFFTPYDGKTPIPEATAGGAFNINLVLEDQLGLGAAINDSVEQSLCEQYIPM